jgi:hypothetical protein
MNTARLAPQPQDISAAGSEAPRRFRKQGHARKAVSQLARAGKEV